jgi:hypothetical protein
MEPLGVYSVLLPKRVVQTRNEARDACTLPYRQCRRAASGLAVDPRYSGAVGAFLDGSHRTLYGAVGDRIGPRCRQEGRQRESAAGPGIAYMGDSYQIAAELIVAAEYGGRVNHIDVHAHLFFGRSKPSWAIEAKQSEAHTDAVHRRSPFGDAGR